MLSDQPQVSAPDSHQVILPSQDPLHYQTHHEISHRPESHLFHMLFYQSTAHMCPPLQDRQTAGPQSVQGFPGFLGLWAPKFCFLPKTSPCLIICPAYLCSPPTASAAVMPQTPLSSQSCLHKAPLGHPSTHPDCGRRLVTREWPDQHRTDKQGLRGSTHHSLYRLLPAHRVPKSKEKQGLMGWQVCNPTASVCACQ